MTDNMTADEKMRTEMTWERFLYEHSHPMAERLLREYQEKHIPVKQAAQQAQVSEVLEFCYTSFGKMRKCDHLDQQIAESSQNMIKATLAAIQGGGK